MCMGNDAFRFIPDSASWEAVLDDGSSWLAASFPNFAYPGKHIRIRVA